MKRPRFTPVISDDEEGPGGISVSRPSLSERTMETLQHIPPSPATRRRQSNFFTQAPPRSVSRASSSSRPGSSYQNDGMMRPPSRRSASSRPTSSADSGQPAPEFRTSSGTFIPPPTSYQAVTPMKRSSPAKTLKTPTVRSNFSPNSIAQLPSPGNALQRSPSPVKPEKPPTIKSGSKTFSARTVKERASVTGLFRKPSMPEMDQSYDTGRTDFLKRKTSLYFKDIPSNPVTSASSEATLKKPISKESIGSVNRKRSMNFKSIPHRPATSVPTDSALGSDNSGEPAAPKSSSSLRDQIAKAKAAKRAAASSSAASNYDEVPVVPTASFNFGLSDDPFNQRVDPNASKGLLRKRIAAARTDGRLNIAAMGLKEIPGEVMTMYNLDTLGDQGGSWAEAVDLTRFIAADNEFEMLDDNIFPDVDPREAMDDDEYTGNQFGGLETLDLHGNLLKEIPMGLRRLELLTSLNLVS